MGIKKYINRLTLVLDNENKFYEEVDEALLDAIKKMLDEKKVRRLEAENIEEAKAISIFTNGIYYHVGIVDMYEETNFYMSANNNDNELVNIDGNYFEKSFLQTDLNLVWNVFMCFVENGELSESVEWVEE